MNADAASKGLSPAFTSGRPCRFLEKDHEAA